jgi:hypothetical protein
VKENLGIVAGEELPRRGRCGHYGKSFRWFRYVFSFAKAVLFIGITMVLCFGVLWYCIHAVLPCFGQLRIQLRIRSFRLFCLTRN